MERVYERSLLSTIAGTLLVAASLMGCGGSSDDEEESNVLANAFAAAAAEAMQQAVEERAPAELAIPALNLRMTAPGGSSVSELLGSQMIDGPGLNVSVKAASESDPATLEAARSEADLFTPTNLADETLADGWVLTYQNTGSMGTNYFATVRREIGGTHYLCSATVTTAEQQQAAIDACKSLRR